MINTKWNYHNNKYHHNKPFSKKRASKLTTVIYKTNNFPVFHKINFVKELFYARETRFMIVIFTGISNKFKYQLQFFLSHCSIILYNVSGEVTIALLLIKNSH